MQNFGRAVSGFARSLIVISVVLSSAALATQPHFQYFPHHRLERFATPLFVDLSGDGTNEIVTLSVANLPHDAISVVTVFSPVESGLNRHHAVALPHQIYGRIVPVPQGDGSSTLLVSVQNGTNSEIWELAGDSLQLRRVIESPQNMVATQVADVSGTGHPEILGYTFGGIGQASAVALDYASGGAFRIIAPNSGAPFAAQLDGDPAMEIVLSGGTIVDGATGNIEWTYPVGFGGSKYTGRFHDDPLRPTFLVRASNSIEVFGGSPYALLRSIPLQSISGTGVPHDLTGDGIDELVFASNASGTIPAIHPITGNVAWSANSPWRLSSQPGIGQLQVDGPRMMVHGGGGGPFQDVEGLQVRNLQSGQTLFEAEYELGPFSRSAFADLGTPGDYQLVLMSDRMIGSSRFASLKTLAPDGEVIQRRLGVTDLMNNWAQPVISVADFDGQPGDEIAIADQGWLALFDGETLEDRWRSELIPGLANFSTPVISMATVDFDGDGLPDVVVLVKPNNFNGKVIAFSGLDGSVLWQSIELTSVDFEAGANLAVVHQTAEERPTLVVLTRNSVYAFDVETRLLSWTIGPMQTWPRGLVGWGRADACRIGLILNSNRLAVHHCEGLGHEYDIELPPDTESVVPLENAGGRFLAAASGYAHVVGRTGPLQTLSRYLGSGLSGAGANPVRSGTFDASEVDVLVGSNATMAIFRVDIDSLYSNGFESALAEGGN